ncbi:MAG: insulinase family protein [Candidatus Buchananbacteria bacterium]|nr:insulinase family protein [Candidatus Buchananbacteria bacterium]
MYQEKKLANGLKLILSPLKETKAVTVLILLPVGSRYETKEINGVSHFIEHLMFKGTAKRPNTLAISKALDAVGAEYNAFTSKDHTGYYVKVAADKIELAFDILSDMLLNSIFDTKEIDKERGVIVEEINMYEDNPLMYIQSVFEQITFGADQPLGQQIAGPRSVIKNVSREKIIAYRDKFYNPANMIVTVAGNFDAKKVTALSQKYFSTPKNKIVEQKFKPVKITQTKPQIDLLHKKTEQVNLCLGFPAFRLGDPKIYPLLLLAIILGGNMSSRLFINVREKEGLAYFIRASVDSYQDIGTIFVQAGLDRKRIKQAISLILLELKKIKKDGATSEELQSAKEFVKGKLVLDLEDSENIADWLGKQQLLLNKIILPSEYLKKIMAVKSSDIKKIANEIFVTKKINLALIGPYKNKEEFKPLLKV